MAITRPKQKPAADADDFIGGAPDAAPAEKGRGVIKGRKRQITLTIAPELLARVDQLAEEAGQSRAGLINMAIYRLVERGL